MSKANTDIKYDPELPYVFLNTSGEVSARFAGRESADRFGQEILVGTVVDTTPKPKIPEDAQHITWGKRKVAYSRWNGGWIGWNHGHPISEEELLQWIGDAEVTVLVRKEET